MRYSLNALKERIRSARRRRDRKRFRDHSYRAEVESLEHRRVLAPLLSFGFFGVAENSPVGTFVGQASVLFPADELTFAISGGNDDIDGDGNGAFVIDELEGDIFVNDQQDLDFETQANFALTVTATDDTGSTTEFQIISLSDVPENSVPVIDDPGVVEVPELAPNGTDLVTITASDPEGDNLTFSIVGGNVDVDGDEILPFGIGATSGTVSITDMNDINFEGAAPNPTFSLVVRATDDGQNAFFGERTVTFSVQDQNDSPVIPDQAVLIAENTANSTLIKTLVASDEDAGQSLTFSLNANPANDFDGDGIGPVSLASNGDLRVKDSGDFNYELMQSFEVSFTVTDDNQDPGDPDPIDNFASTTTTVTINLLNVIENLHPIFDDDAFSVSENAANGTVVGMLLATDPDDDNLTFEITAGNGGEMVDRDGDGTGPFAIDGDELIVADTDDFDSGALSSIPLTIRVTDDGEDNLFDDATITVSVLDVNDPPELADQSLAVAENSGPGALVGDPLGATDPNDDTLTYALVGPGDTTTFNIGSSSGQITVAAGADLDFESQASYSLNVQVTDNGVPSMSVTADVTVLLSNQLENGTPIVDPQTFPPGEGATFAENQLPGTLIGTATFTDPAVAGQLPDTPHTFSITGGNPGDAFTIDPVSGDITVDQQFAVDFETQPTFSLEVSVTDSGEGSLVGSAIQTINLRNANDPPSVLENQVGIANETAAPGEPAQEVPFGNVFINDWFDQDPGDTVTHTILSQTAYTNGEDPIDVSFVDADDPGAFRIDGTTGEVFHDNPEKYDFDALYTPPAGFDPDDPEMLLAAVTIELEVVVTDQLGLVSDPEILTIALRNFDDAVSPDGQSQSGFNFLLGADVDNGGPLDPLSANEAVGDCTAQLSPDHNSLALVGCGTDSTEDGTASIHDGSPDGPVLLDGLSVVGGDLPPTVWTPISTRPNPLFGEEDEPEFIPAPFDADALESLLEDDTLFLVFDLPGGDVGGQMRLNPNGTDAFVVDENADGVNNLNNGDIVGQVVATDPQGYPMSFEIISGNPNLDGDVDGDGNPINALSINAAGQLVVNDRDDFDADQMAQMNVGVRITNDPVVDNFAPGHPSFVFRETPQSTNVTVEINLRNINDAPIIDPFQQFGSVQENAPVGVTQVGAPIQASDGDGDPLTFSITNVDPVPFAINATTGQVTVAGPIDFETDPFYNVTIEATDGEYVANGLLLVLVLNQPENTAPTAPDNVNNADPLLGGLDFDLDFEQAGIDEEDDPGTSGSCTFTYDPLQTLGGGGELGSLNIVCTHDVNATAAHVHLGAPGVAGPVVAGFLPEGGASPLVIAFDQDFAGDLPAADTFGEVEAALLAGDLYVNVHSEAFPGGEIRGQIPAPSQDHLTIGEDTSGEPVAVGTVVGNYGGADDPDLPLGFSILSGNTDVNGNGVLAFAIDESTADISVLDPGDLDHEALDKFFLEIGVTDQPALDAPLTSTGLQQINVLDKNDAPALGPQFTLFSPLDVLVVDVNGVDVDRNQEFIDSFFDVVEIETTGLAPPAINPTEIFNLGLFVDGQLFFDFFGAGEKWLRAAPAGPGGEMAWYLLLPSGEFLRWDGQNSATGDSLGFFGAAAYADPIGEIVEADAPGDYPLPAEVDLEIDLANTGFGLGETEPNTFTITRESGAGTATVTVAVCDALDGSLCDTESFDVVFGENIPPVLDPIGDQATTADELAIPLSATDPNPGAQLAFSFELYSPEKYLGDVVGGAGLDFRIDGSDFRNVFGADERWVRNSNAINGLDLPGGGSIDIRANAWFFILPDNTINLWDNTAAASGTMIAQLNSGSHADLSRVIVPSANPNATGEIAGGVLTLTKDPGFFGGVIVRAEVTDGADEDSEVFRVDYNAP